MRRWWLTCLALGLIALLGVVNPRAAYACSCAGLSQRRAIEQADAIFTGTVRAVAEAGRGQDRRREYRFEVAQVYKGTVYQTQLVSSPPDSGACGISAATGDTWTIFARQLVIGSGDRAVTRLQTDLCSGNLTTASPPGTLGRAAEPRPGESNREERAATTDRRLSQGLVVVGFGALGVVVVVGVLLGLAWRRQRT